MQLNIKCGKLNVRLEPVRAKRYRLLQMDHGSRRLPYRLIHQCHRIQRRRRVRIQQQALF